MQRVETYIVTKIKAKSEYLTLLALCHKSKNLYNYANYIVRQTISGKFENIPEYKDLIHTQTKTVKSKKSGEMKTYTQNFISEYALTGRLGSLDQVDYRALKAQCSQQIVGILFKNYKAFYKASADYFKHPGKYKGRPALPAYKEKDGLNVVVYTNQNSSIDNDGHLKLAKDLVLTSVKTSVTSDNFVQARIVPRLDYFKVEIVYNREEGEYSRKAKEKNRLIHTAAVDIGVGNLATVTSDNADSHPLIVSGRPMKSINQIYNKRAADLKSIYSTQKIKTGKKLRRLGFKRAMQVNDYMHKASRRIVDWCILNDVKMLYVGHNPGWKQNCDMSKRVNQNFVQIPFNVLIQDLKYKLEDVGIQMSVINEAYTSKCSALDSESIGFHDKYAGKRVKRGLFQTKSGCLVNADVNGSLNILRSGLKKDFKISDKIFNPIRVKQMNEICDACHFQWLPADSGAVSAPDSQQFTRSQSCDIMTIEDF